MHCQRRRILAPAALGDDKSRRKPAMETSALAGICGGSAHYCYSHRGLQSSFGGIEWRRQVTESKNGENVPPDASKSATLKLSTIARSLGGSAALGLLVSVLAPEVSL